MDKSLCSASTDIMSNATMSGSVKKPSLLYIGHSFHARTHSTDFLLDILRTEYEIKKFSFDPFTDDPNTHFRPLYGSRYHVVLLFQVMPDLNHLQRHVHAEKFVFVPMFDYLPPLEDPVWETYRSALVICFSSTLHDSLLSRGFHVRFIRFWPSVPTETAAGNPRKVFFWQRVNSISIDTVSALFQNIPLEAIHHHKALDPGFYEQPSLAKHPCLVTESRWFPRKADLVRAIESAAIYMAPRPYEGIGMAFLEAMAMGRCVVAPDNPTMSEYIEHGRTGLLYNVDNPAPLDEFDVRSIQRAARAVAAKGRRAWEARCGDILDWIREWRHPATLTARSWRIPATLLGKTKTTSVFWLLGILPVLRISAGAGIVVYWLLCFLPAFIKRKQPSDVSLWLFGIVRLWKSEVEHE